MPAVMIYTTPTCGFCKMAKSFLHEQGVAFTEKDVSADAAAQQEMMQKSGQTGVPVIDVDGAILVGFDKNALSRKLGLS